MLISRSTLTPLPDEVLRANTGSLNRRTEKRSTSDEDTPEDNKHSYSDGAGCLPCCTSDGSAESKTNAGVGPGVAGNGSEEVVPRGSVFECCHREVVWLVGCSLQSSKSLRNLFISPFISLTRLNRINRTLHAQESRSSHYIPQAGRSSDRQTQVLLYSFLCVFSLSLPNSVDRKTN